MAVGDYGGLWMNVSNCGEYGGGGQLRRQGNPAGAICITLESDEAVGSLDLFDAELSPQRYCRGPRSQKAGCGVGYGGKREGGGLYLTLHCHHQSDFCINMGSNEIHFKPVTAPVCKISGLKNVHTPLKTVYFPVS